MPDCSLSPVSASAWQASLRLAFAGDGHRTRLVGNAHRGPLRVQKALYPEGPGICHAIVLHPPGGVVGGDRLAIEVECGARAHALLSTPGAAKWYRANGRVAGQQVRLTAGPGAAIEWLPQESIFYNQARVELEHDVELAIDARYLGLEILCFGRRAAGEQFTQGSLRQRTRIRRAGQLLWWEQGVLDGAGAGMHSALGLGGASVCATLIAVAPALPAGLLAAVRGLDPALAASQLKTLFVARYLGHDSETARRLLAAAWQLLRPPLLGCAAPLPRIWNT
ncbi:MAG: urease accessory protein UreD [Pseudomonadota bacterium]